MRTRSTYASAAPVAAGFVPALLSNPLFHTTTGRKRPLSHENPARGAKKREQRRDSLIAAGSCIPTSSMTHGIRAISPGTGFRR